MLTFLQWLDNPLNTSTWSIFTIKLTHDLQLSSAHINSWSDSPVKPFHQCHINHSFCHCASDCLATVMSKVPFSQQGTNWTNLQSHAFFLVSPQTSPNELQLRWNLIRWIPCCTAKISRPFVVQNYTTMHIEHLVELSHTQNPILGDPNSWKIFNFESSLATLDSSMIYLILSPRSFCLTFDCSSPSILSSWSSCY